MTAALFSGQGSQYPGMGTSLIGTFPKVREIYECAGDILGMDLIKLCNEADAETLSRTLISQPMIFTLSIAAYTMALEKTDAPDAAAGHSLGEFAALWAAGAFGIEDGFRIIKARAEAMNRAATEGTPGAMYAIIGPDEQAITEICAGIDGFVVPANFNLTSQTVISGEEGAAAAAAEALAEKGAKCVKLGVSTAFHTKMMANAAQEFKCGVSGISYSSIKIPFYSNLTGGKHEIADYPAYFAEHMISPVRFAELVSAMVRDGLSSCVEYGPGKTAVTLAKKNAREISVANVEDAASLEKLSMFFAK